MVQDSGDAAYGSVHDRYFCSAVRMVPHEYVAALGDVRPVLSCVLWRQCDVHGFKGKDGKPKNGGSFDPDEAERNGKWRQ